MSTRSSVLYADDGAVHLFEDCLEDYERSGLHLDLSPVRVDASTGQYGDFALEVGADGRANVSVRLPFEVCEAIVKYVLNRREFRAQLDAEPEVGP